jgi:phage replication initiation protein
VSKKLSPAELAALAYARASSGESELRFVKAQIYAHGKGARRTARAPAACEDAAPSGAHPTGFAQGAPVETPINNMGVTLASAHAVDLVMTDSGEIKQVMVRIPAEGQCAVIDWVNFTVLEDTWFRTAREHMIDDNQIVGEASRYLEKIFGFGVTAHRERGMNFYRDSWVLGDDFGFVCFGGQRQTMLITLNGHGCVNAADGWEKRLHQFLTETAIRPVISRCDLAHDDFEGAYLSVDWAEKQWHSGGYTASSGGIPPSIERIGNWHRPSGKGRTLTIGRRTSGKFVRFYEKGRKDGDKLSEWLRCEVEYKSSDRVIPFEILLSPSDYFAATYPCFAAFTAIDSPRPISVKRKTAQIVIDACVEVTRHQFGKYLRVFRDLYGDKEALDMVCNPDKNAWPKRMKPLTDTTTSAPSMVFETPKIPSFVNFLTSVAYHGLNAENGFSRPSLN